MLPERQVKYAGVVIVKKDTSKIGMSRKEVVQVILKLSQAKLFVQSYKHLEYLI